MRNIIGLQLVSIVLSNNINPYYNGLEVNLEGLTEWQFYDKLSDSLINQSKKGKYISVTAAEVNEQLTKSVLTNILSSLWVS